jgi:hypothetical protein
MPHTTDSESACLADDSSVDDSERASAASAIQLSTDYPPVFYSIARLAIRFARTSQQLFFEEGPSPGLQEEDSRRAVDAATPNRDWIRTACHRHLIPATATSPFSMYCYSTRALMRALGAGRSRWLNGLCRCRYRGSTNIGTGPRPSNKSNPEP